MHPAMPSSPLPTADSLHKPSWKWAICGLLLLATTINYMDRLTLNLMSVPIMDEFRLDKRNYGQLESAFGIAFAFGAILIGWMADRWNVRGIYAASVLIWSLAGLLTGLSQGFVSLLLCRFLLGLAESGNWPCALRTTQRILPPSERTMGNGLLQSGAALGAVLTPIVILLLYNKESPSSWRFPFLIVATLGIVWVVGWWAVVRDEDLALTERTPSSSLIAILGLLVLLYGIDLIVHFQFRAYPWIPLSVKLVVTLLSIAGVVWWMIRSVRDEEERDRKLFLRRFAVLAVVVSAINMTWHFFRAWLPLFLQQQHGYSLEDTSRFSIFYYIAADVGCLAAGYATLHLARSGWTVHASRMFVFSLCSLATLSSIAAAVLPSGWPLLAVLLLIAFATLGLFPNYYSFTQELSSRHQGKVTGALGCICWLIMSLLHEVIGDMVERTGSYSSGVVIAGLLPMLGVAVLALFWHQSPVSITEPLLSSQADSVASSGINGVSEGVKTSATHRNILS
jgi:ACS family hexuronate transporter-like MFS transporter